MEGVVNFVHGPKVSRLEMTAVLRLQVFESSDHGRRRGKRNPERRLPLQQLANLVDLGHLAWCERTHGNALVLLAHHDAGALQLSECSPDEMARHAEARDQV